MSNNTKHKECCSKVFKNSFGEVVGTCMSDDHSCTCSKDNKEGCDSCKPRPMGTSTSTCYNCPCKCHSLSKDNREPSSANLMLSGHWHYKGPCAQNPCPECDVPSDNREKCEHGVLLSDTSHLGKCRECEFAAPSEVKECEHDWILINDKPTRCNKCFTEVKEEGWEKEFDKEFGELKVFKGGQIIMIRETGVLKNFIKQTLHTERERVAEKIRQVFREFEVAGVEVEAHDILTLLTGK